MTIWMTTHRAVTPIKSYIWEYLGYLKSYIWGYLGPSRGVCIDFGSTINLDEKIKTKISKTDDRFGFLDPDKLLIKLYKITLFSRNSLLLVK